MLKGQVSIITVNTKDAEYEVKDFANESLEQSIDIVQSEYPDWTSLVIVIVK